MGLIPAIKKVTAEIVVLLLIFGYSTYYYFEVAALPSRTINLLLIQPVFLVILISTVALIFFKIREALRSSSSDGKRQDISIDAIQAKLYEAQEGPVDRHFIRNGIAFGVCTLAFVLLLDRLGFVVSSFLYLSILIYLLGSRSFWLTIFLPAAVVGFLYVTMVILLRFPMPQGMLI